MNVFLSKTGTKPNVFRLFNGPFFNALYNEQDGRSDPKLNPDAIPLMSILDKFKNPATGEYVTLWDGPTRQQSRLHPDRHQMVTKEINTLCDEQLFNIYALFLERANKKFKLFGIKNPPFGQWTADCLNETNQGKGVQFIQVVLVMMVQYFYIRQACMDSIVEGNNLYFKDIEKHFPDEAQTVVMVEAIGSRLKRKYC